MTNQREFRYNEEWTIVFALKVIFYVVIVYYVVQIMEIVCYKTYLFYKTYSFFKLNEMDELIKNIQVDTDILAKLESSYVALSNEIEVKYKNLAKLECKKLEKIETSYQEKIKKMLIIRYKGTYYQEKLENIVRTQE